MKPEVASALPPHQGHAQEATSFGREYSRLQNNLLTRVTSRR